MINYVPYLYLIPDQHVLEYFYMILNSTVSYSVRKLDYFKMEISK